MAAKFKLTYWEGSGLGLHCRLAFHYAGIEFEDFRFEEDAWDGLKAKTPLKQVPILEYDGKVMCESNAILRYVCNIGGLSNQDDKEKFIIDEAAGLIDDVLASVPKSKDAFAVQTWIEGKFTVLMNRLDDFIARSGSGYIAPSGISLADFKLWALLSLLACGYFTEIPKNLPLKFKNVSAAMERLRAEPKLQKFFEAHPGEESFFHQ